MKVLVDTNLFIDILLERPNFYENSIKVIEKLEKSNIPAFVAPITFNNVAYVGRKVTNRDNLRKFLQDINDAFFISPLSEDSINSALNSKFTDFEDAITYYSALESECDYVVTRNTKDFKEDLVNAVSPEEFLEIVEKLVS